MDWTPSPSGTVWRKRVHLVGPAESGQVTSVVRYEPRSTFHAHEHPDGEEILVLDGVFSDEHGDWPAGTYLLNPEGFRHAPFSREGCVLFVKLRQFPGRTREHVATAHRGAAVATDGARRSRGAAAVFAGGVRRLDAARALGAAARASAASTYADRRRAIRRRRLVRRRGRHVRVAARGCGCRPAPRIRRRQRVAAWSISKRAASRICGPG